MYHVIDEISARGLVPDGGGRDDFLLEVVVGGAQVSFSDTVSEEDRREMPVVRADLESMKAQLKTAAGRLQRAKGHLSEELVRSYFVELGYEAELAPAKLDAMKVDVIAKNGAEQLFVQSKDGTMTNSQLKNFAESVKDLPDRDGVVAVAVAADFERTFDALRRRLEVEFSIKISCLTKSQLLAVVPKLKHVLS